MAISRVRLQGVAAVLSSLCVHSLGMAAETARVAVVHARDDEPSRRVRGELAAAGLDPVDVRLSPEAARSTPDATLAIDAVAAVRIVSENEMELVIVDASSKSILYQKVVRSAPGGDPLALRAVEDLRARLVKLKLVEPTPAEVQRNEAPPTTNAPAPPVEDRGVRTATRGPSFWATGALGSAYGVGGLDGGFVVNAGLRYDSAARWAASLSAMLPVGSHSVSGTGAHAEVRIYTVNALAHYVPLERYPWRFDVGAGGAFIVATMEGFSETPALVGRSETLVSGAPLVDVSASLRLTSMVRLRVTELRAGIAIPRLAVTFEDRHVAEWGRPFVAALIGAEIALVPGSTRGEPQ